MCSIDAQFRKFLPPKLGQHYDQLMRARSGLSVDLPSFDVNGEYGRVMARDKEIPESFVAIQYKGDRPSVHESAKCFQHLADLKTLLGPKFPWYDPAKPGRPGFFVAGSFATPCWDYKITKTSVWSMDENGKGVELTFDFHVPKGRGDVDLFIAGSGDAVDMAAEALVYNVMIPSEKNPFMRAFPVHVCTVGNCQTHFRNKIHGGAVFAKSPGNKTIVACNKCITKLSLYFDSRDVYSYIAKHLVAFDVGPLKIEVVTRVYRTPEKCPALFDLTYDGGIYMGGDDVRFLDIALYQHDNQILLATPFSGSSTQELRHLKKVEAYGLDLVVPGLKWDASMASQERGLTVVRDVLKYRAAVDVKSNTVSDDVDTATRRFYRCILKSGARSLKAILAHYIADGVKIVYSFVPGCKGSRIHFTNLEQALVVGPVVLVDVPGTDIHVGAFSFTPPAEFVKLWCMDINPDPLPKAALPDPDRPDPKTIRRASKAFSPKVRNLVTSFDVEAVVGAKRVVLAPGERDSIDLGFSFELAGVEGAQIWKIDFSSGQGAPVIRCKSMTGIYMTGDSVCMGAQTHYHDSDIPFSLSAMVTSLAERPALIIDGVEEHVESVGVMNPIAEFDVIVKAHADTLEALDDDRWILGFDVPSE
jgi:hypothetical protein